MYSEFLSLLQSEKEKLTTDKITSKWIRDLLHKTRKQYTETDSLQQSISISSVPSKPIQFLTSLRPIAAPIPIQSSNSTLSFMIDCNSDVYPIYKPVESEELQTSSEVVQSDINSEPTSKENEIADEEEDEEVVIEEEEEDEECTTGTLFSLDYVAKSRESSQKKKRSVKEAPSLIEMGDTQGIEFIYGLEYITNIINDRVIPEVGDGCMMEHRRCLMKNTAWSRSLTR